MDAIPPTAPGAASGPEVASQAKAPGVSNPPASMAAVQDVRLADLLARRARKEKLSASDRGYLGAKLRTQTPKRQPVASDLNPLLVYPATPVPADNPLFVRSPAAAVAVETGVPFRPDFDSEILRKTADGILTSVDTITQGLIGQQAAKAGGDETTVQYWRDAVAMKDAKPLMAEGSEPVIKWLCEQFGCAPEELESRLKGGGFFAGLALWGYGCFSAVKSLKEMQREKSATPPLSGTPAK